MKNLRILLLVVLCVALTSTVAYTKDVGKEIKKPIHRQSSFTHETPQLGVNNGPLPAAAQAGTTWLGSWSFDSGPSCIDQGWTTADITVQPMEHWHVDDFSGLAGGSFGNLFPLEGNQSMWCGARADASNLLLCGYGSLPGYGNSWDQYLCSPCFTVSGAVELTYYVAWDSEPGYDQTTIQVDNCDDNWTDIASSANARNGDVYDNFSSVRFDTVAVSDTLHGGSVRIRFNFNSDAGWSDQDGIWNTDGAIILDSMTVSDNTGIISFEDFEGATVGDNGSGDWNSCNIPGYGDFAALYPGLQMLQEDPCFSDLDCMWSFFTGSNATYACGGFPATLAVPFVNTRDQYIQNHIYSPVLPWVGTGSVGELTFNVYRDLPLDNLVFYEWRIRSWHSGCPSPWLTDWGVYFGPNKDWFRELFTFGEFVEIGATDVQLAIGVRDMCVFWCGGAQSGACHSHAPLIDAVDIYRVALAGPQWNANDFDLFQDNFATDGTLTGTVRVDMANDILPRASAAITPGDSAVVRVTDPVAGLAADPYTGFGASVYGYVRVDPPQSAKSGDALSSDAFRFPVVDSVTSSSGDMWYIVRMDSSFGATGRTAPLPDEFCLDLNDNLLTPGDTLWFFFGAQSADVGASWNYYFNIPRATDNRGVGAVITSSDINVAMTNADEMTCLPAAGLQVGNDILYVDDASGRGVQPYFDTAFQQLGILGKVDRFDVRNADSNVGNGLGSRVTNVGQQLIPVYKKIIWNSSNLNDGLIGDGDPTSEKSNDFFALWNFIDQSNRGPGLWVSGDYSATDWAGLATVDAIALRSAYMNFNVLTTDHKSVGLPVSPLVIGVPGGAFDNIIGPDTLVAYGGCNLINEFDVLQQSGLSTVQATYNGTHTAILSQSTANAGGSTANIMLSGFSYHYVRDDRAAGVMDRVIHLKKILTFLGNDTQEPTAIIPTTHAYSLSQNYPNPFNPTTTINYTLKEQAQVSLRIYNVAGQLIRNLVEATKTPGEVHTATWDGRNDAGQSVSSGVYFYKLVAGSYVQTKKMVLLK